MAMISDGSNVRNEPYVCHSRSKSVRDAEEAPTPRDTLQMVFAAILKFDARADHEVLDGARDKDLVR
jgi:hypothetical protein